MTTKTPEANVEETARAAVSKSQVALRKAETLEITTPDEYLATGVALREVKSRAKEIEEEKRLILRPLDEARRQIMALFRPAEDNLVQAERLLKAGMLDWTQGQERLRQQEQARLQEIARKEADRLAAEAERAAAKGQDERAAVLQKAAASASASAPVVAPPPGAPGTSIRQTWRAVIIDKLALIKAVAASEVSPDTLEPNMVILNQMVREVKGAISLPGVQAVAEETVVSRSET